MDKIVDMALTGLSAYDKAESTMELGEATDIMAECLEEILCLAAEINPEVADMLDDYFSEKYGVENKEKRGVL